MSEDPNQPFIFNYDKPEEPAPPAIQAPPVAPPPVRVTRPASGNAKKAKTVGPIAGALLALLTKIKALFTFLIPLIKLAKAGKILLTMGTMLLSIWAYAQLYGVWFAVGFVVLIFVHEMGHVWAAREMGIPASAPIFIPFMGALILTKNTGKKEVRKDAIIGIGGPALGTAGAAVCAAIYGFTGNPYWLGLASAGFFINLFNLTPIYPLDGGWIVRAISPIIWIVGMAIMLFFVVTGTLTNPMIYLLILLGLPTMWTELRNTFKRVPSPVPASFRWSMGAAYVALIAICAGGTMFCDMLGAVRRPAPRRHVGPAVSARPSPDGVRRGKV